MVVCVANDKEGKGDVDGTVVPEEEGRHRVHVCTVKGSRHKKTNR